MNLKRGLALFLVLVALFLVIRESREPYVWLFVDDLLDPKPAPLSVDLSQGLAVRLYADPRPHTGKVARLQKGLILVVDGQERVEEGFGFGLPLIEVDGQAYLSRSATVERVGDNILVKHYDMDTQDTPSGFLRRKYKPVPSIGTVTVTYTVAAGEIGVVVDLTGLEVPWNKAYIMNEGGARFFTRYEEDGLAVEGPDFGRWQPTTAPEGCIVASDRSVKFCVETLEPMQKYYGRERYNQYYWVGVYVLSWAGLDLELEAPTDRLEYQIRLERPANG